VNITQLLLPRSFLFSFDRSFDFVRERQQLYLRVQFIYLHSSLSFFVPSCPRPLSLAGLNADGNPFLETSVADSGTAADTNPSFSSTGQDKSTSGAATGVIQDITDAPEISSDRDSSDEVVNPWWLYCPSTSAPTNVEFHSDAEKAQHAAAVAPVEVEEQGVLHGHADADIEDLRRDSPPETQPNATGGFFFGYYYILLLPPPPDAS
jgi:hypothetical protein